MEGGAAVPMLEEEWRVEERNERPVVYFRHLIII